MSSSNGHRPLIGVPLSRTRNERGATVYAHRPSYLHAIHLAGGAPVTIPLELTEDAYRVIFDRLDGILLAGGEDIHPSFYDQPPHALLGPTDSERDRVEVLFAQWSAGEGKPILGICRGHQVLNVALGGTMYQDIQTMLPGIERHDFRGNEYRRNFLSHTVLLQPESLIANILGEHVWVNSLHHQTVDLPGHGLQVVGTTPGGVIEGVELKDHPFAVGVQWHPEELISDENMLRLFESFVQACDGKPLRVLTPLTESNGSQN